MERITPTRKVTYKELKSLKSHIGHDLVSISIIPTLTPSYRFPFISGARGLGTIYPRLPFHQGSGYDLFNKTKKSFVGYL